MTIYNKMLLAVVAALMAWPTEGRAQFSGGDGTESNPYLISSVADLKKLSENVNRAEGNTYYSGLFFQLTKDLDLSGEAVVDGCNFQPIGNADMKVFAGIFDGNGHTISGIRMNRTGMYAGVFGHTDAGAISLDASCRYQAAIRNLTVANSTICGEYYVGGIVGFNYGALVENCHVAASVTIGASTDNATCVGGITGSVHFKDAGMMNLGSGSTAFWAAKVRGCTNAATVTTNGKAGCSYLGGIAGNMVYGAVVGGCLNTGTVDTNTLRGTSGGIVGFDNESTWSSCSANYYAAPCTTKGVNGMDLEGARMAVILDTAPEGLGEKGTEYASFPNAPGLTVYANGIYYAGKYYYYDKSAGDVFPLYEGDEGTEARPYQIKTVEDMRLLASSTDYDTDYNGKYFTLTADLDFGGGTAHNYTPVGNAKYSFRGTFDGQGHTLSGIVIDKPSSNNGVFGRMGGLVKNLVLANTTIVANVAGTPTERTPIATYTGGIVGVGGSIENCHVMESVTITVADNYITDIGGIVGSTGTNVLGCTSAATIVSTFAGSRNIGGIAGHVKDAKLRHCINLGPVTSDSEWAGSVVGYSEANSSSGWQATEFEHCYYAGRSVIGGMEGAEIDNVWRAEERTTKPSAFLSKVSEYKSFASMPAITVYKNCLLYNGIYYYHNPNTPLNGHFPRYEGDEGTAEKPYQIKTLVDLKGLQRDVNSNHIDFTGKHFALKNDLDFEGYAVNGTEKWWKQTNYTPIGWQEAYPFVATFDGEGHSIKGIVIQKDEKNVEGNRYLGVFGRLGATGVIKNLTVADSYLCMEGNSGPVVGAVSGTVENCHSLADMVLKGRYDYQNCGFIGGIAGFVQSGGKVTGCTNQAALPEGRYMGGIVAFMYPGAFVSDCLNLGKLPTPDDEDNYYGGVVGRASVNGDFSLTNCYYAGECNVGGVNNEDTDGARKAVVSQTKPQGMGSEVTVYTSYDGAPGLTAYDNGLYYDGVYYTSANSSTAYTFADVARLLGIIAGKEPYSAAADLNGDGKVDIADVIIMIKKI